MPSGVLRLGSEIWPTIVFRDACRKMSTTFWGYGVEKISGLPSATGLKKLRYIGRGPGATAGLCRKKLEVAPNAPPPVAPTAEHAARAASPAAMLRELRKRETCMNNLLMSVRDELI